MSMIIKKRMKNLNVVIEFDKLMYVKNNIQKKTVKTYYN
jgi:hypothetical protein